MIIIIIIWCATTVGYVGDYLYLSISSALSFGVKGWPIAHSKVCTLSFVGPVSKATSADMAENIHFWKQITKKEER